MSDHFPSLPNIEYLIEGNGEITIGGNCLPLLQVASLLSQETQVSARTLQQAFLECFGLSPKAYLRVQRLNNVQNRQLALMLKKWIWLVSYSPFNSPVSGPLSWLILASPPSMSS